MQVLNPVVFAGDLTKWWNKGKPGREVALHSLMLEGTIYSWQSRPLPREVRCGHALAERFGAGRGWGLKAIEEAV